MIEPRVRFGAGRGECVRNRVVKIGGESRSRRSSSFSEPPSAKIFPLGSIVAFISTRGADIQDLPPISA